MTQEPDPKKTAGDRTPLMQQYHSIKARHHNAVLFFRMGDFFEMFYEDAKLGSKVLGITLTSRGHGKAGDVPLAGFPHHALDGYLAKMIRAGLRVAVCEQVENPKFAKGIVKREVIQVVTPGTVVEDSLLETKRNNFLAALFWNGDVWGVSSADVSTGEFLVTECPQSGLRDCLAAVTPSEVLAAEDQTETVAKMFDKSGRIPVITKLDSWIFRRDYAKDLLIRHFKTASLKGFGCEDLDSGLSAAGAVLHYLKETQRTDLVHIRKLRRYSDGDTMILDAATRRNLEISVSMMTQDRQGTLHALLDRTLTSMGGRTLASWVARPLIRLEPIRERLDAMEELLDRKKERKTLADLLKGCGDLERLLARTASRRATPRDVQVLGKTLARIPEIREALAGMTSSVLASMQGMLDPCSDVPDRIARALVDDPPPNQTEGGVIRPGYSAELDALRETAVSGKEWIARLQTLERQRTKIPSLKVGYNRVFGYYIEVTNPHLSRVPPEYIRKQTLVNAERYLTPELKEMEDKILHAEEKMNGMEADLFDELRTFVAGFSPAIQEDGQCLGRLDALVSLAAVAEEGRYTKPVLDEGDRIVVEEGRHPVVERLLPPGDAFIPNDVDVSCGENQILIITGPNMAGKSTYIRQVGLIVLLAQIGSYVPAAKARIGLVDRIFTRVGAQDNVAGGESTFLVEMNETANILNNATSRSLILLDEIGRGTSTFDGLSIAWAVAEYLHNTPGVQAKTLFATHYHELTELALILPRVKNFNVAVKEWGDSVIFLRKIVPGGCDHSYGIQVARLAGLPREVIIRAREVLGNLENNELTPNEMPKLALGEHAPAVVSDRQLNMFAQQEAALRQKLKAIDIDALTPLEALKILDQMKKQIEE